MRVVDYRLPSSEKSFIDMTSSLCNCCAEYCYDRKFVLVVGCIKKVKNYRVQMC